MHNHQYNPSKDYSGYYKFTVVRHPYSRIVSYFLKNVVQEKAFNHRMFNQIVRYYKKKGRGELTFQMFIDYLTTHPKTIGMDEHLHPMIRGKPKYLDLFIKLEDDMKDELMNVYRVIFKDYPKMMKKTEKLLHNLTPLNTTNNKNYNGKYNSVPISSIAKMEKLPTIDNMLTNELKKKIRKLYSKDFRTFGYES